VLTSRSARVVAHTVGAGELTVVPAGRLVASWQDVAESEEGRSCTEPLQGSSAGGGRMPVASLDIHMAGTRGTSSKICSGRRGKLFKTEREKISEHHLVISNGTMKAGIAFLSFYVSQKSVLQFLLRLSFVVDEISCHVANIGEESFRMRVQSEKSHKLSIKS
jgi:hypothetical protein